jgi:Amt family ammonium transporter
LAAASGGLAAFLVSLLRHKQYDLSMFLNGLLGGLVGITAGADIMSVTDAIIIGSVAGTLIVLGVGFVDRLKLDDPVGAIAVHLICGIWGTLAVGIFGEMAGWEQLGKQAIGIVSIGVFCIIASFTILGILKKTIGIRVSEVEEQEGLDIHEHGMDAYPDFRLNQH